MMHFPFVRFRSIFRTWDDLRKLSKLFAGQRVKIGKLAESTVERYEHTFSEFETFLDGKKIRLLRDITVPLVEEFKVWRVERNPNCGVDHKIKSRSAGRCSASARIDW